MIIYESKRSPYNKKKRAYQKSRLSNVSYGVVIDNSIKIKTMSNQ